MNCTADHPRSDMKPGPWALETVEIDKRPTRSSRPRLLLQLILEHKEDTKKKRVLLAGSLAQEEVRENFRQA